MTGPLPLTDGRFVVPGNRWDLLAAEPSRAVRVGVVIPHYEQPAQLALVLRALELQDYASDLIEVVVADDGSANAPDVTGAALNVRAVRQEDRGFRAAAARNLGAAATTADVLCFLDADTVPEPGYLRHLVRLPSLLPDALVVARRRHADLTGLSPAALEDWWAGRIRPEILPEPGWLVDAYAASADLLHADLASYRHVISAVMCCSRELFDEVGGFDESFREYGGEDWEFAHRAMAGGAVLHHARDAVAWHDGPDWGDRPVAERAAGKNREALAMARLIPDPAARRFGLRYDVPAACVEIDTASHGAGSLVTTMAGFLGEDVGIWLTGPAAAGLLDELGLQDPRVHAGPVPDALARRCRFVVRTTGRPLLPDGSFAELLRRCGEPGVGEVRTVGAAAGVVVQATWAVSRRRRWTNGHVRLRDSTQAAGLSATLTVAADSIGLVDVEPDADLSW
ncbi:hypothetical protein MMAD_02830 [Mycolicibacterium madagascariense]|uniref:Glycosyl transferase n=1 Tax=Mycolicibacterium madagascariense TaxID=212765 RepID=A0A7I7XC87_9MYCO|nr:glycosyltransferase [Mycolicibacterium madagascariense]MCV7012751.1 glycosyltransferase [Mycolicibacterium madagascariense]BBZ25988.1 hypothetical protein MMAD_02830 [Mycolicibacterium madagascariense]